MTSPRMTELINAIACELEERRRNFPDRQAAREEAIEAIRMLEAALPGILEQKHVRKSDMPLLSAGKKVEIRGARLRGIPVARLPVFPALLDTPEELLWRGGDQEATEDDLERAEQHLSLDRWQISIDRHGQLVVFDGPRGGPAALVGTISADALDDLDASMASEWAGPIANSQGQINWVTVTGRGRGLERTYDVQTRRATDNDLLVEDAVGYLRALDAIWSRSEYKAEATERHRAFARRVRELVEEAGRNPHES